MAAGVSWCLLIGCWLQGDVFYVLINSDQVTGSMLIRQVLASAGMTSRGNDSAFPVSPTLVPEAIMAFVKSQHSPLSFVILRNLPQHFGAGPDIAA